MSRNEELRRIRSLVVFLHMAPMTKRYDLVVNSHVWPRMHAREICIFVDLILDERDIRYFYMHKHDGALILGVDSNLPHTLPEMKSHRAYVQNYTNSRYLIRLVRQGKARLANNPRLREWSDREEH